MLAQVAQFIRKHDMLPKGSSVLVGVSGGMDSVALLHALYALREKLDFTLAAAHMNHGIRAEAAEEEQFVTGLCTELGVPLHLGRADVPALKLARGLSLEVAAREARHGFFRDVMAEHGYKRLALAHHRDDQAETVLLRLIRGAGADGLSAMAPSEGTGIIRPLLCMGREDIRQWAEERGLAWREDRSNADLSIPRNWVRHELLPSISAKLNPQVSDALCRTAALLREDEQCLDDLARQAAARAVELPGGEVCVKAAALATLPPAVMSRALRLLLKRLGLERDVECINIEDIAKLLREGRTGCRVDLDGGAVALREAQSLVLARHMPEGVAYVPVELSVPGRTQGAGGVLVCELLDALPEGCRNHSRTVQFFDYDAFPKDAVARGRQQGDRFFPLGAPGRRKLKEYFIDRKLSRWARDAAPLVASGSEVLWAVGHAISDTVKVTDETTQYLKITYIAEEDAR